MSSFTFTKLSFVSLMYTRSLSPVLFTRPLSLYIFTSNCSTMMLLTCASSGIVVLFHFVCLNHVLCRRVTTSHTAFTGPSIINRTRPLTLSPFFIGMAMPSASMPNS